MGLINVVNEEKNQEQKNNKKLTFRGRLFLSDNSEAVRLVILKNDFGRLGEVGQHDKNVLVVRGRFWYLATFPLWRAGCLQDPSENAHLRSKV